jgi:hypothetical protein
MRIQRGFAVGLMSIFSRSSVSFHNADIHSLKLTKTQFEVPGWHSTDI